MTKILFIVPPYIPSYFNAGHHLPLNLVYEYINKNCTEIEVKFVNGVIDSLNWHDVAKILWQFSPDIIVMFNDFDGIDTFPRFLKYINQFSFNAKTITFGRGSKVTSSIFETMGIDCIVTEGDYEVGVLDAIKYFKGDINENKTRGIRLKDSRYKLYNSGEYISPDSWVLPSPDTINVHGIMNKYKNDLNKFCGIPYRSELVVPIARGCPIGCSFCDVPKMQGRIERRLSVDSTISYIKKCVSINKFEYFSFYAPTFTLQRKWVVSFCDRKIEEEIDLPWKCVTIIKMLSESLIAKMSQAGCMRISVGIETLEVNTILPKIKQNQRIQVEKVIEWCHNYDIELNFFVILGLPGDSHKDVANTIKYLQEKSCRVRPTIYTDYSEMHLIRSIEEFQNYNRQFLSDGKSACIKGFYELFFNETEGYITDVHRKISKIS